MPVGNGSRPPSYTLIPSSQLHRLMKQVERIEKRTKIDNMIPEDEAAKLLGVSVKTLQNNLEKNKHLYTVSPIAGKRFYYKDRLLGL